MTVNIYWTYKNRAVLTCRFLDIKVLLSKSHYLLWENWESAWTGGLSFTSAPWSPPHTAPNPSVSNLSEQSKYYAFLVSCRLSVWATTSSESLLQDNSLSFSQPEPMGNNALVLQASSIFSLPKTHLFPGGRKPYSSQNSDYTHVGHNVTERLERMWLHCGQVVDQLMKQPTLYGSLHGVGFPNLLLVTCHVPFAYLWLLSIS